MRFFFLILFLFFYSLVLKAECIKGDCINGVGVFQFEDGNKYIGQFKNSNYDGKGTFRFKSGAVYTGQFKNGKYNGLGVYQFIDGSIYSGDYLEGLKNGFGTYTFNNGDKYEGEFKNGNYHGYGIFKFINGDSYDGEWSDGKYNGIGTFTYSNGQINYGRFENNKLVEDYNLIENNDKNNDVADDTNNQNLREVLVGYLDSFVNYENIIFHNKNSFTIFNLKIDDETQIGELFIENFNDAYINSFNSYNGKLFDKFIIKNYSIKNNLEDHSVEYIQLENLDIKNIKSLNKLFFKFILNEDFNSLNLNEIINLLDGVSIKNFIIKNAKIIEEDYLASWDNFEISNVANSSIGSMIVDNMRVDEYNEIVEGSFLMKDLEFSRPNEYNIDLQLTNFIEEPHYFLSFFKKLRYLEFTDYYYKDQSSDVEFYYENFLISEFVTEKINNLNIPVSINISSNNFEINMLNQYANLLNYENISFGFDFKLYWNTDKQVFTTNLDVMMNNEIKISSEFLVNNLNTYQISENSDIFSILNRLMVEPKFDYMEITIQELGLVSRLVNYYSRSMNMTNQELIIFLDDEIFKERNKFPDQYEAVKDQDIEKIIDFINYPETIKFSFNPNPDLSFNDIAQLNFDLSTLINNLNFKIH
tara:strand:+ start:400 stop:2328 length:1929 start_codon:yes stop_codon:yes gene_type:complete